MGSFSVWHWASAVPFFLIVVVIGIVLCRVLKIQQPSEKLPHEATAHEMSGVMEKSSTARGTTQTLVSLVYLTGGAIGLITTIPQLDGVSLDLMSAIAWLFLLVQLGASLYGGWQLWNSKPIGAQVLYWLSWSCVPLVSFTALVYWCAIGLALFPMVSIGAGNLGADLSVRFGYASRLWFNPGNSGLMLGVNLVALYFVFTIEKLMRRSGIRKWPLVRPNALNP